MKCPKNGVSRAIDRFGWDYLGLLEHRLVCLCGLKDAISGAVWMWYFCDFSDKLTEIERQPGWGPARDGDGIEIINVADGGEGFFVSPIRGEVGLPPVALLIRSVAVETGSDSACCVLIADDGSGGSSQFGDVFGRPGLRCRGH
jgi:hypothetical protein